MWQCQIHMTLAYLMHASLWSTSLSHGLDTSRTYWFTVNAKLLFHPQQHSHKLLKRGIWLRIEVPSYVIVRPIMLQQFSLTYVFLVSVNWEITKCKQKKLLRVQVHGICLNVFIYNCSLIFSYIINMFLHFCGVN